MKTQSPTLFGLEVILTDGVVETPAGQLDVSRLGIALTSYLHWEPGTTLTVRFRLPAGGSAVARAVVRGIDGDAMELSVIATGPMFARLLSSTLTAASEECERRAA